MIEVLLQTGNRFSFSLETEQLFSRAATGLLVGSPSCFFQADLSFRGRATAGFCQTLLFIIPQYRSR